MGFLLFCIGYGELFLVACILVHGIFTILYNTAFVRHSQEL